MIKKNTSILLTLLMGAITPSLYASMKSEESDTHAVRQLQSKREVSRENLDDLSAKPNALMTSPDAIDGRREAIDRERWAIIQHTEQEQERLDDEREVIKKSVAEKYSDVDDIDDYDIILESALKDNAAARQSLSKKTELELEELNKKEAALDQEKFKSPTKKREGISDHAPIMDDSDGFGDDTVMLKPFTEAMNNMPQGTAAIMDELTSVSEDEQRSRNIFEGILTELSDITFNENIQIGSSIFTKFIRALETGYLYYNNSYWKLHENMWHIDIRLNALQKISAIVRNFHDEAKALNLKTDALRKSKKEAFEQSRNEDFERIVQEEKALESSCQLFKKTHTEQFILSSEAVPYHSLGLINKKQYSAARATGNQKDTISFLYLTPHEGMIPFDYKLTLLESLKGSMIQPGSLPKEDAKTHHQGSFVDPISGRLLNLDVTLDYEAEGESMVVPITLHDLMDDTIRWSARPSGDTDNPYTYSIHLNSEEETKLGQLTISLH